MSEETTIDLSTEGYTTLEYPSPDFRPIPAFTFDVPPGWVVSEFADALCFVATPADAEGPWSNVFVQHERVLPTTALEDVAVESWDQALADFPDATVVDERLFEFEQYHYVRESEMSLLDETVTRVDSFWFSPDTAHPTVDLFHLVGLHPVEAGTERTGEYLRMLSSFRFTDLPVDLRAGDASAPARPHAPKPRRRRGGRLVARPHDGG